MLSNTKRAKLIMLFKFSKRQPPIAMNSKFVHASAFQDPPFELVILSVRLFGLAEL